MDTVAMLHYGPIVIAACSLAALTVAGILLVCAYMSLFSSSSK